MATFAYRPPDPLKLSGSAAAENWERFYEQWRNYVLAMDLTDATEAKKAAIFLTCIGAEAYDVFRTFELSDDDRAKIDPIVAAFKVYCVGTVNVTYERYVFNRRVQENGERFDNFLGELRRMARTCEFGAVADSMLRDRIVVGIRDDGTRHKLLQVRDLDLKKAIDICRASETAQRQLKVMTSSSADDAVHAAARDRPSRQHQQQRGDNNRQRDKSVGGNRGGNRSNDGGGADRKCRFCGRQHGGGKASCPAFGKTCKSCGKLNHFKSVCFSSKRGNAQALNDDCRGDDDSEALTLTDDVIVGGGGGGSAVGCGELLTTSGAKRWFTEMSVDGRSVRFLIDCGATVNLLPFSLIGELGRVSEIAPTSAKIRMFDRSELAIIGEIRLPVCNFKGQSKYLLFYVARQHAQAVLGIDACKVFDLVRVNSDYLCAVHSPDVRNSAREIAAGGMTENDVITAFPAVFDGGVGRLPGLVHLDVDETVPPVQMPLRRIAFAVRERVKAELDRLKTAGIIAPVTEPAKWVSPLLVVPKANGRVRLCMDPKHLNRALRRVPYTMPTLPDILPKLQKVKVMSSVDAAEGFFHCELDYESSLLTTTETPYGRVRWLRLPFGLSPSPEIFQAKLEEALADLDGIACIADDVIILGAGDTEVDAQRDHDRNLQALLRRCHEKGIKLNRAKLKLNCKQLLYCGHLLENDGYRPDPRKIDAILRMPAPTDKAGVQRLIGMATYLAKFCPKFSQVTEPLRELIKAQNEFIWRQDPHGAAFEQLKQLLTQAPVLAYFDHRKQIVIQADASNGGLGAAMSQDGQPCEFISRAMTSSERNYAQIEKECLAILWALERFDSYVYLHHDVVVETDHKPLLAINRKALGSAPKRLQRLLLRLLRYKFDLQFKPGSQMLLADTLSRAFLPETASGSAVTSSSSNLWAELAEMEDVDTDDDEQLRLVASPQLINILRQAATDDDEYRLLRQQVQVGWPNAAATPEALKPYETFADELAVYGDFVFKGLRVIVPLAARPEVLKRLHGGHIGLNGCIRRAQNAVYYPGITRDIKNLVAACEICKSHSVDATKEPLRPHPVPTRPWQRVGTDIFTHQSQDYLLTVDYLSGYIEVDRLASKRCKDVIYALRQQFARHGIPDTVVSDNSPFGAAEFKAFAQRWEFEHVTSSPNYSQSNGRAENAVKTVKRLIQKAEEANADPLLALLDWRNTPAESSKLSPAEIIFGRQTRTLLPSSAAKLTPPTAAAAIHRHGILKSKEKQAEYYNRAGLKEREPLPPGQTVRVRFADDEWRKAETVKALPNRSYEVRMQDGTVRRRTSRHIRRSAERPIVLQQPDPPGDGNIQPSAEQQQTPTERANPPGERSSGAYGVRGADGRCGPTVTRSGRVIKLPVRFRQ
jgi:transposase InsO family protein